MFSQADFCEGFGGSLEEEVSFSLPDSPEDAPLEDQLPLPHAPPAPRRGSRPAQPRSQGHKTHGGYSRQPWRNTDHGGDGRYWTSNRGGRGSSGCRGRGTGRGGTHGSSRIIPEHKEYSALSLKGPCMIESGLATKGHGRPHDDGRYENGNIYHSGDNRAEVSFGARGGGGGGSGKRGSKGSGSRQRYGPGRGRGRGPPAGFGASSQRHSAQDWS